MFTRQAPNIAESLFLSGLPQAAVAAAQNFVGQCRAAIEHRGPVQFDYTNPRFRFISPQFAPINPHGNGPAPQNFPEEDPGPEEEPAKPIRPQNPSPPEHAPEQPGPRPGPGEEEPWDPGLAGNRDYRPGSYIGITKRSKTVFVQHDDSRRHPVWPAGRTVPNEIGSVKFRSETRDENFEVLRANAQDTFLEIEIQERTRETLWRLWVKKLKQRDIITNIYLDPEGGAITVVKESAWVFDPTPLPDDGIALGSIQYVSDVTLGATDLEFTRRSAVVFTSDDADVVTIPLADCSGA